jgi:hypothetical protein
MEISSLGSTGPYFEPSKKVDPKQLAANLAIQNQQIQQQKLQMTTLAVAPRKDFLKQLSQGAIPSSTYNLPKPGQEKNSPNTTLLQGIPNLKHPLAEAALKAINPINFPQISFSTALIIALILASVSETAAKQNEQFLILGAQISNQSMEQAKVSAAATVEAANASADATIAKSNAAIAEAWIMVGITIITSVLTMGLGEGASAEAGEGAEATGSLGEDAEAGAESLEGSADDEFDGEGSEIELQELEGGSSQQNKQQLEQAKAEKVQDARNQTDKQQQKLEEQLKSQKAGANRTDAAGSPKSKWTQMRQYLGKSAVKASLQMSGTTLQAVATTLIQKIIMQNQAAEFERQSGRENAVAEMSRASQGQLTAASQQLDNSSKQTAQFLDKLQQTLQTVQTQNQNQFRG